jgi:uncharacterized protein
VKYSEERFFGKKLTISITTNGTLLTKEMILFFNKHNVSLMVSLDGPKGVNDKNRVFADGGGTFDTVIKHIELIKQVAPEYFKKLLISMVVDPVNDFDCINNIFLNGSELDGLALQPSGIDHEFDDQKNIYSEDYCWKYEYQRFLAVLAYFKRFPYEYVSPIVKNPFFSTITEFDRITQSAQLLESDAPSGPCIPGKLRLFVDVNGKFFPCERVSEKSTVMCLGSINSGFDISKADCLLNIGRLTELECKHCWSFRYCVQCAKMADNGSNKVSAKVRLSHCEEIRSLNISKISQSLLLKEIPVYYTNQIRAKGIEGEKS